MVPIRVQTYRFCPSIACAQLNFISLDINLFQLSSITDFRPKRQPHMPLWPYTIPRLMHNQWNVRGARKAAIPIMHRRLLAKHLVKLAFHLELHMASKWPAIGIHQHRLIQLHQLHQLYRKANFYKGCRAMRTANLLVTNKPDTWGKCCAKHSKVIHFFLSMDYRFVCGGQKKNQFATNQFILTLFRCDNAVMGDVGDVAHSTSLWQRATLL